MTFGQAFHWLVNNHPMLHFSLKSHQFLLKAGEGPNHTYKVTGWKKKNTTSRNKNLNPLFRITCCFIQGFICSFWWIGRWSWGQLLVRHLFSLLTHHSSTHPNMVDDNMKWRLWCLDTDTSISCQGQIRTLLDIPYIWFCCHLIPENTFTSYSLLVKVVAA